MQEYLEVVGSNVHNLKNLSVRIPRNKMVVVTGISGSGKSSLAFDTIYAEGQRRYMETFSAYARQFIGNMERPDVEEITGLSPVISIEQKTTGRNPRSTVGTITEIYDFMRLLFARASDAYSYATGKIMVKYTEDQIIAQIFEFFLNKKTVLLAPLIKGRKGHYRELFEQLRKQGYTKVRVDGEVINLTVGMQLDRYKVHDIEAVIDRIIVSEDRRDRIVASLQTAMKMGEEIVMVLDAETNELRQYSRNLMCADTGISYEEPSPNTFSFNSPYGYCPSCKGLGELHAVDMTKVIPDNTSTIAKGGIAPLGEARENMTFTQLKALGKKHNFTFDTPLKDISPEAMNIIMNGGEKTTVKVGGESGYDFQYFDLANEGLKNMLLRWYSDTSSEKVRVWAEEFMEVQPCSDCQGTKLKKESLCFKLKEKNISELANMDITELAVWMENLEQYLSERQKAIAKDVLKEIVMRINFLLHVGLDYLTLNRTSRTLSGGESQRIRLATQIGSKLTGITYILDEPSIGLHQRDNQKLIEALRELARIGNTVIVVEHDKDIMLASDYLIDLGPGAGKHGGELVGEGIPSDFIQNHTITSEYLNNIRKIALPQVRRKGNGDFLILNGATGNNLKNVSIKIPLATLTCITGVSGSGKSTLINETLYPILRQHFYNSTKKPLAYKEVVGLELLDKVIEIDQSPIGRTPRSNPATYTGVFNDIRKIFAELPEAKIRGYKPGRFSFNVKGGRCEECEGAGRRVIEMNFLPDVEVDCERCFGRRYNRETLEVLYKGKSISDILDMPIAEAVSFFENIPNIFRKIKTLNEVGLGYVTLGQQATTLSGGEAQRVKLAEELSKRDTGKTIYILDEPTTGLHFEDIQKLLEVLYKLVNKSNTVVVIEHNMDVIKVADYIIDMGPEGGARGGNLVCEGTPEEVAKVKKSFTGQFLKLEL
jgi:excinuclease ABC subunit A